ncbi:hypothetical protein Dimus_011007 [Dionaea muscipula]
MFVIHLKKKDVMKSKVKGVELEFDHEKLATILGVPRTNGICEYIKDVWEESKYTKPLEITRRFANDENLMAARRVKSGELKPFQRFVHFLVMKNVVPRFGKRDTSSFLDLTYMDHLMSRRLVNLPRVMIRHMSYVISMKDHELPYGDWLTMWIGSGENRRRDDDVDAPEEEAEEEEEGNKDDFDWEADKEQGSPEVNEEIPAAVPQSSPQQKEQDASGVDPSCPTGRIPEAVMTKLQAEFERKRANRFLADLEKAKAENARLLALLHQAQSKPNP